MLTLRRLLQESLTHALVLSPLVLGAYWLVADHSAPLERIVIDGAQVATLRAQFRSTWSREPTEDELDGLVSTAVREEILVREGESLGLRRSDPGLKQRVLQKYEQLAEAKLATRAPTDEELTDWLYLYASNYVRPPTVSYSQLLLVAAGNIGDAASTAWRLRTRLERGTRPSRLGLPSPLPRRQYQVGLDEIALDYGQEFADVLARLPVGIWLGPVESRYGAHLVRVDSRIPGRRPTLDEVRAQVTRDYEAARHQRALEEILAEMRRKYEVVVTPANIRQAAR